MQSAGQPRFGSRAEPHPSLSARPSFHSSCHPAAFTSLILLFPHPAIPFSLQSFVHLLPLESLSPHPFTLTASSLHPVIMSSIHPSFPNHPFPFRDFHPFIPPLESLLLPFLPLPPALRYLCPSLAPSPCHNGCYMVPCAIQ